MSVLQLARDSVRKIGTGQSAEGDWRTAEPRGLLNTQCKCKAALSSLTESEPESFFRCDTSSSSVRSRRKAEVFQGEINHVSKWLFHSERDFLPLPTAEVIDME